ncbi:unnamed protein product [Arabidopsis arenosa]|uniref:Uncharacterized protein n=1 Tax=Arabidopsis arenosa TaxID=38785 RepID=A0A8S2ALK9_ARAAE|nr:unnamed protein product [Arabidopsis arenosa]
MLQLKPRIIELLKCEVGNGNSASFWFDSWTDFGQLITFLGDAGPRQLHIRRDTFVADASRNGDWTFPAARSENAQALMIALTAVAAPAACNGSDIYLWRKTSGEDGFYNHEDDSSKEVSL